MSHIKAAQSGLELLKTKDWALAAEKLSKGIAESANPAWLLGRSQAYIGLERYEEALDDANAAWHAACDRSKRDLILEAQYRRAVANYRLKRYADADACCQYAMRLADGRSALEKTNVAEKLVNDKGFYTVTLDQVKAEAAEYERLYQESHENRMPTPVSETMKMWRLASFLRNSTVYELEKLPEDDPGRKLTVAPKPEIKKVEPKPAPAAAQPTTVRPAVLADTPVRWQHFETDAKVTISIFSKGVSKENLKVVFDDKKVSLSSIKYPSGDERPFEMNLWGEINAEACTYSVTPSKVELQLQKKVPGKWKQVVGEAGVVEDSKTAIPKATAPTAKSEEKKPSSKAPAATTTQASTEPATKKDTPAGLMYPSSSRTGPKNWDTLDFDEETEESEDVNGFFKKLFKDATPEQQRAMMKSYTESNGTSLSTDWDDVGSRTVETVPPDGMEAKKWS